MFKYVHEINREKIRIKPLTNENYNLVKGFYCGNETLDMFIIEDALYDDNTLTYLLTYVKDDTELLFAYFSISASGVSQKDNTETQQFNISAVEINNFALNKEYQHLYWNEKYKKLKIKFYLSDILFNMVLEYIMTKVATVVGVSCITLYSVPEAESLYRRNNFCSFEDYMIPYNKRYLDGCIPLYLKLKN